MAIYVENGHYRQLNFNLGQKIEPEEVITKALKDFYPPEVLTVMISCQKYPR